MFEFEAVDFPLNAYVSKSGQGSTASRNCRRNCRQWVVVVVVVAVVGEDPILILWVLESPIRLGVCEYPDVLELEPNHCCTISDHEMWNRCSLVLLHVSIIAGS